MKRILPFFIFPLLLSVMAARAQLWQPIPVGMILGGGGGGCSQATTFIARTSGENNTALTTMICGLVTDGLITGTLAGGGSNCGALFDRMFVFAMANSTDARLDVCGNASATEVSTPTFTANAGYTGSATAAVDTGFNPSTAGVAYTQNDSHMGAWFLTDGETTAPAIGQAGSSTNASLIYARYVDGNLYCDANSNSAVGEANGPVATAIGLDICNRTSSSSITVWQNTTSVGTAALAAQALINNNMYTSGVNNQGVVFGSTTYLTGFASFGASLSSGDITALHSRMCTYLTTVHGSC